MRLNHYILTILVFVVASDGKYNVTTSNHDLGKTVTIQLNDEEYLELSVLTTSDNLDVRLSSPDIEFGKVEFDSQITKWIDFHSAICSVCVKYTHANGKRKDISYIADNILPKVKEQIKKEFGLETT